ncbi:aryl-sulfate sulfotransferase [Paraglaciecola sp. 25GB23A]|uniref:aryl-sulfate sulfotransferase n=2 Tax=Bacteria TaxID=2 RepID=UPI0032AFCDF9
MNLNFRILLAFLIVSLRFLSGCGGAGNSDVSNANSNNSAPIAEAGDDQNVITGSIVSLNGNNSSDPDNDLLTFSWTITSMPAQSNATLSKPSTAIPSFTADVDGSYQVSLRVNDGTVSSSDTLTINAASANNNDGGSSNFDFSISAHPSNVLMVKAHVTTSELSEVTIQFESANTTTRETSKSSASLAHDLTVFGLRPETDYRFTAKITTQSGDVTNSDTKTYTTPSLPFNLPDMQLKTSSDKSSAGLTFFSVADTDARFIGVDEAGIPVWYLHNSDVPMLSSSPAIKYLGDGQLMLMLRRQVWVIDIEGNILSSYQLPTYHHDASILANGNIAILVDEFEVFNGNGLKGDRIQEYSPAGNLVWEWSSFEHLDTDRFPGELSTRNGTDGALEWSHSNAIYQQQDDGSLLLSVRSQSWVVNIDHDSGNINWILGSAEGTQKESLLDKFITLETGSWMSAQHAPMKTVSGDYLIYDNRNEAELAGGLNNSRAVKYHVNTETMTATQVWEHIVDKYTKSLGDVDELPNGNILITAGGPGSNDDAYLVEVTATEPSQVVWELQINNASVYRAERIAWDSLLSVNNEISTPFTLSGKITGLHADGLALISSAETLSIPAGATTFEFTQTVAEGTQYLIQLAAEPTNHTCNVGNGSGVISGNIDDIAVLCIDHKVNADLTHLPIGDPLILQRANGDNAPAVGKLWLCRLPEDGAGAPPSDDWTNADGSWNYITKPQVTGENYFSSEFNMTLNDQGKRVITGNNLPTTPTGTFPIERNTLAYEYDRNPNSISSHNVQISFDAIPSVNAQPSCVGFAATGISLTGSAIYQGSSTLGTDASAYEMLDSSGGHTDGTETYHYHYVAENVLAELDPNNGGHSKLMGYIQDGFGIFGPRGEDGRVLASADLDECHGHTHEIEWDNQTRNMYHYHWTYDFPYNVGCLRGTPQDLGINAN